MANVAYHWLYSGWESLVQTIGDTAAKWWLGVAGVLTAAGIVWGASFAFQSSLQLQHLTDQVGQMQIDLTEIKHRLDGKQGP